MTGPEAADAEDLGTVMHRLMAELYPICRSITGDGVRATLRILQARIPLTMHEVPSGTPVFDWTVPREWNIRDAYVKDSRGERVIDFRRLNLHVVNGSRPVAATMTLEELRPHLHTDPDHPDWVPYRTAYYADTWGFCLSQRAFEALADDRYNVRIDSTLTDGALTYGEYVVPGSSADEVLISCHVCHPSLCNDNLSGIAVTTLLAQRLAMNQFHYTYRFVFLPATIGPITWLSLNQQRLASIKHGLVAANLGDPGKIHYKRTRHGSAEIDQVVEYVLAERGRDHALIDFEPYGYDERQYGSPGINLPVGCLMRTPHGRFPEYHTSADNLDLVRPAALAESLDTYWAVVQVLDANRRYLNLQPMGEPQLGRRGLYTAISGDPESERRRMAVLWVLNLSDGHHTLLDIAKRSGLRFNVIAETAAILRHHGLLDVAGDRR